VILSGLLFLNSCEKEEPVDDHIRLDSFGPSPVLRGGDLKFIGNKMNLVTSVELSSGVSVTTFKNKAEDQITIVVPDATVTGPVTLKTPEGDIHGKTILTISEPISITSFAPGSIRPGGTLTINGTYLNLVTEVIFNNKKSVTTFASQSQTKIEVLVPEDAQSGIIVVSNGMPEPILVESLTALDVALPSVTGFSPDPVKAGTELTITGTNMDLTKSVTFAGGAKVTSFNSIDADKVVLNVPANAQDGPVKIAVASLVEVTSASSLTMKVPVITNVSPNPAKNGQQITVTGIDLDLITGVRFGGDKAGQLLGGSSTEITVGVPLDAIDGLLTFQTASTKSVSSPGSINMVLPTIGDINPLDIQFNNTLTISGTDLDLAVKVVFIGGTESPVTVLDANTITAVVPVGTQSGPITIETTNGSVIGTSISITILASTSAVITSMPSSAKPGQLIDIVGENFEEVTAVIFPDDVPATMYGLKTPTLIQVVIPLDVKKGKGKLKLITANGEEVESPEINIQGVDDVVDPALVFFNFDGLNKWWGDTGDNENDASLSLDGSTYFRVNNSLNGWTGFFWRNSKDNFPADVIGANASNYVLKFDINVLDPISGGEFAWRFKGGGQDYWYYWKPWATEGPYKTDGWITVTIPLTDFYSGSNQLTDLSIINEDFGVAFNNGSSSVNACFDNVRFQLK